MLHSQRPLPGACSASARLSLVIACVTACVAACGDDGAATTTDGGRVRDARVPDASAPVDVGASDAGSEADAAAVPDAGSCTSWSGEVPINDALRASDCVAVEPGTYLLSGPIVMPAGATLIGATGDRADARFVADEGFDGGQILTDDLAGGPVATVESLTFDSAGRTNGLGTRYLTLRDLDIANGGCWGVAVAGYEVTVEGCDIHHNGANPDCPSAPGGGVYVVNQEPDTPGRYAPTFRDNRVRDNTGPGFDIAGVWDGVLHRNDIRGNTHWAAVSLFGSHWHIYENAIYHPAANAPGVPDGQPYWGECRGGPNGVHPAAIMICQRNDTNNDVSTDNDVHDNDAASYYGIQLIGNDEARDYWVPRNNRIADNDLTGSTNACVDDLMPGQWDPPNEWIGCAPDYF